VQAAGCFHRKAIPQYRQKPLFCALANQWYVFVQVLRNAFDFTEAELESSPLDLTRSGTTAVLGIVTSNW